MQIVWNQDAVEQLRKTHTLFQLETFQVNDKSITTYCVIPVEKLVPEFSHLPDITKWHMDFLAAYSNQDLDQCEQLAVKLIGRLGGELDSFYQEIIKKLKTTT